MSDYLASGLIMMSEFALMFAIAFAVIIYKIVSGRKKNREQVKIFVEKLRTKEPERNSARIDLLKTQYNLDDEAIKTYIEQLSAREKSVYGKIIKISLGKDKGALKTLDDDIDALLKSCNITADIVANSSGGGGGGNGEGGSVELSVDSEQSEGLAKENVILKEENEKLVTELEDMKKQASEMMAEYTMMYGKQGDLERKKVEMQRDKVKKEINDSDEVDVVDVVDDAIDDVADTTD